jgi:beta-lactamase superfamily II metal-dependent hydrolase
MTLLIRIISLLVITSITLGSSISLLFAKDARPHVAVHFIDIGQGDAALIIGPTGKTVLLDSGPSKSWSALKHYLDQLKITHIDLLINSHPHADHIGNAARVIERYHVKAVLDLGFIYPIRVYSKMFDTIQAREVKLLLGRRGRTINMGGDAKIHILGPEEPFISNSRSDPNSNSIIFRLSYRNQAALFTGDAEEETERRLLADPKSLRADLLKVAHHGSKHASSRAFLDATRPKHAVISCSERNRYGHPAPETLAGLRRFNIRPWVTADVGSVIATTHGDKWQIRQASGEHKPDRPVEIARARSTTQHAQTTQSHRVESDRPAHNTTGSSHSASTKINVNTADQITLMSLPRIGEKLSGRIIKARTESRFSSVDELRRRIRGIGPKSAKTLAPLISF